MLTDRNWTKTVMGILLYSIAFGYYLYPKDGIGGNWHGWNGWKGRRVIRMIRMLKVDQKSAQFSSFGIIKFYHNIAFIFTWTIKISKATVHRNVRVVGQNQTHQLLQAQQVSSYYND